MTPFEYIVLFTWPWMAVGIALHFMGYGSSFALRLTEKVIND